MTIAHKWTGPALVLTVGIVTMVLSVPQHHAADGAWVLGVSVVLAGAMIAGGGSDLIRTLRGDPDERGARVAEMTSNIVLNIMAAAAVVGAVVEQSRGMHWGPWTGACVAGGALYALTFLVVRALV